MCAEGTVFYRGSYFLKAKDQENVTAPGLEFCDGENNSFIEH